MDSNYTTEVYSSHPDNLNTSNKTKISRSKRDHLQAPPVKRSFSFSRFFRRSSKSRDYLFGEEDFLETSESPEESLKLGRIYFTSSINIEESGSWSSLLDERSPKVLSLSQLNSHHSGKNTENKQISSRKGSLVGNNNPLISRTGQNCSRLALLKQ